MIIQSLAFLLGILMLQHFTHLPHLYWVGILLSVAIALAWFFKKSFYGLIALMLGFSWALWYSHHNLDEGIPKDIEGKTIEVTGYIASLPVYSEHGVSFLFNIEKIGIVKLNWRNAKKHLTVGDKWHLSVRLKKIHGSLNPGGFDYEGWALQAGIRGAGYVINKGDNVFIASYWYHAPLDRLRQYLQHNIEKNLPKSPTSPWIEALIIGERHNIPQESWNVLRNTGTNHLMAIAGLHIGLMAALMHHCVSRLVSCMPRLVLLLPAQQAGAIAALIMALIYSALAGFSIPTQRACLMLTVFLMTVLLRRKVMGWNTWAIALLLVLLINPLDVMTESFWLSFGSVALIIYGMSGRLNPRGLWWKWGRVQWVIAVGLIPLSIGLFHQFSLIGFIANTISIPWVAFLVVPICLLGTAGLLISAKLGGSILGLADKLLSLLWWILSYLSHLSWASFPLVMPNVYVLVAACVGFLLLLLPAGLPGRYLGIIWILPLLFYKAPSPKIGEAWLTLLDVGQGLSAVVQTNRHLLIFDTGPRLSEQFDAGENEITPFLYTLGTKKIDGLVISHGDNDHIGGAGAILKHFPVQWIKTSVPEKLPSAQYCLAGESWEWDHVQFKFLYPAKEDLGSNNDSSCVLLVSAGKNHILLTGDIEKEAEKNLAEYQSSSLASQILIAPHHGSKTSIRDDFIQAVHPTYVLYATGYRNRYHFPHEKTIEKYNQIGAQQLDTVTSGAIQIKISDKGIHAPLQYRKEAGGYWNL